MPKPLSEIKLFLLDLDGTVYLGDRLFDCTKPFLEKLRARGVEHLYLTNNSSKDKAAYLEKLERLGIGDDERHMMTSGDATIDLLKSSYAGKRIYLVGTAALRRAFEAASIALAGPDDADIAVVGFDTELTYEKLSGLYRMVGAGKPYICTHPDLVCPAEDGFIPDIGAVIAYIDALTGRKPDLIVGKPERYLIDAAAKRFGVEIADIAMVGDRLYTDIAMAGRVGATSVLVLSGETKREDLKDSVTQPDYVVDDLSGITRQL